MNYPEIDQRILDQWQETTNLLIKLCNVPVALIMRKNESTMEVMSTSSHCDSPFEAHETTSLNGNLYCERVMKTQSALYVSNALHDPEWKHNPYLKLGMISYYGVSINWPEKVPFGTLCILGKVEKYISDSDKEIINQFAKTIETSLELLLSNQQQKTAPHERDVLLNQLSSLGKIGYWSLNFETNSLFWSPEIYSIHGVNTDEYTPELETAITFYHPDDITRVSKHINDALVNKKGWNFFLRIIRADGEIRSVRSLAEISRNSNGEPISLFGVFQDVTEYEELNKQVELLSHVANTANAGVVICDKKKNAIWVNQAFTQLTGYEFEEILGNNLGTLLQGPKTNKDTIKQIRNDLAQGNDFSVEVLNYHKNGDEYWNHLLISAVKDIRGDVTHFIGIQNDITEQKEYVSLLRENEDKYRAMFETALVGMTLTDNAGKLIEVNQAYLDIIGYTEDEVKNLSYWDVTPKSYKEKERLQLKSLQEKGRYGPFEKEYIRKDGQLVPVILNGARVLGANNEPFTWSCIHDITQIKKNQAQLERTAHYDLLTSLPNRSLLADRLTQAMVHCNRHKFSLAVLFIDLDGFKQVNDAYGHDVGDELLIITSQRMQKALREGDTLARIGGDEFIAVLTELNTVDDCKLVLERLLTAASKPVNLDGVVLNISASIGVSLYPQDNADEDILMRHADQAMYIAKDMGKNCYHFFDTAQDVALKVHKKSLKEIRIALDSQQLILHYQPKVNMRTGSVIGVEALIRWQHPKRGLLSPIEFLPNIENNPLITKVGEWVIDTALSQINQWQKIRSSQPPISISVNIAAFQLQQPDFIQRLKALLAKYPDVKPQSLELEVLETSALDDVQHISTIMNTCKSLGVNFALDDFGTGYSSLTYLRRLPANLIKIDQSFVRDMLHDADDLAIIEGVIGLAKSFKRDVIAEGVETVEHGIVLLQLGCDFAQGYGIAKPMPASEVPNWIHNWKPDVSWQT